MNEIYETKLADAKAGIVPEGMDLMGEFRVKLSLGQSLKYYAPGTLVGDSNQKPSKTGTRPDSNSLLSKEEILGNAFVFILAGHETAANTIHFALLYLAMNRNFQETLQNEVDQIFGEKPINEWDYEKDLPKLFNGMAGAVMNEELRLLPPVINIPKSTLKGGPQPMTLKGRKVVVPEDTYIQVAAVVAHRNPNYWPTLSSTTGAKNDLDEFNPARWLSHSKQNGKHSATHNATEDKEDFGGPDGDDTSASMFQPPRGSYIPFSDGPRACLGRRFAQIEVLAALAVIFRDYSVELDVGEYATQEEVQRMPMGGRERKEVWQKAHDRATYLLRYGMMTIITIQMRSGRVPLRFVKRGSEQFVFA